MDYVFTNILVYVQTIKFLFPVHQKKKNYSYICGSLVITPYTTFVSSSVFEIGCVSRVNKAL